MGEVGLRAQSIGDLGVSRELQTVVVGDRLNERGDRPKRGDGSFGDVVSCTPRYLANARISALSLDVSDQGSFLAFSYDRITFPVAYSFTCLYAWAPLVDVHTVWYSASSGTA